MVKHDQGCPKLGQGPTNDIKSLKIIIILKYLNHISGGILWQRQFENKMKVTIDLKINFLSYILISGPFELFQIA